MTQGEHVFLSYARSDGRGYVERLDSELTDAGFKTWWDVRDIPSSQDFGAAIEMGIEAASVVAVCVTEQSKRIDGFVRREIHYALGMRKPVIPLRFADIMPHVNIATNEWIDFFKDWSSALDRLLHILGNPTTTQSLTATAPVHDDLYRDYLDALYQNIVKYLDKTVLTVLPGQRNLIQLEGQDTPDAVKASEDVYVQAMPMAFFDMAGIAADDEEEEPESFSDFAGAVAKHEGRLLLLGNPGAGKTTTLMAFARDAVAHRLEDATQALPVLVPIVTWNPQHHNALAEWLAAATPALKEGIDAQIADGKLLLLPDGLDELGSEREEEVDGEKIVFDPRRRFMDLLTPDILAQHQVIVSSRIKDYDDIGAKFALRGAITLHPLNDAQMQSYLRDLPDLWRALTNDDDLREVARTPLLLSLFAFAFKDADEDLKALADLSEGDLRDKIFETYIERRYQHEARKPYANIDFSLEEIYAVLERVAARNVTSWKDDNVLYADDFADDLSEDRAPAFIKFCIHLNILVDGGLREKPFSRRDEPEVPTWRFIHLLLRDYFAYRYAMQHLLEEEYYSSRGRNPAETLGALGDKRAFEPLLDLLKSPNDAMKSGAISALGVFGDARAIPYLIDLLADGQKFDNPSPFGPETSGDAASQALGKLGHAAVDSLLEQLGSDDPAVRGRALDSLGEIGDARAIPALIELLSDEEIYGGHFIAANSGVGGMASYALGKFGQAAVEPLLEQLESDDPAVRRFAAIALGEIGDARVIPALIGLISDEETYGAGSNTVGDAIAIILGYQSAAAVDPLLEQLEHEQATVQVRSLYALRKIKDPGRFSSRRTEAGEIHIPSEKILPFFHHDDSAVLAEAIELLGWIGDEQAVKPLIDLLDNVEETSRSRRGGGYWRVCDLAADALRKIGTPEARAALEKWRAEQGD